MILFWKNNFRTTLYRYTLSAITIWNKLPVVPPIVTSRVAYKVSPKLVYEPSPKVIYKPNPLGQ